MVTNEITLSHDYILHQWTGERGAAIRTDEHSDEHHWTVRCVRSTDWSTFHRHLHFIPMYLTLTKTLPKCHFTYRFAIFISPFGSTHDSADCWSAHRSPVARETASNVCKTDASLGVVGRAPQTKILATPVFECRLITIMNNTAGKTWNKMERQPRPLPGPCVTKKSHRPASVETVQGGVPPLRS